MNDDKIKYNFHYNKKLKHLARNLRNNPTITEKYIWSYILKSRQLKGYQFLRQRPIGKYVADFFCKDLKLIIELDGLTHEGKEIEDKIRQKNLENSGYTILRFKDAEVMNNIEDVQIQLEEWIEKYENFHSENVKSKQKKSSPLNPPFKGGK
jgi:very-short-patch-repair endonuclease